MFEEFRRLLGRRECENRSFVAKTAAVSMTRDPVWLMEIRALNRTRYSEYPSLEDPANGLFESAARRTRVS
jgi:hypothetical protein